MPSLRPSPSLAQCLAAAALLLLMGLLAGGSAHRESITVDEVAHLGAGVSYLQHLDMRMNPEHPPLAKVLAAAPLVVRGVHADYSSIPWDFSSSAFHSMLGEWVWGHEVAVTWNDPSRTLFRARLPMLALTLLLGFAIYVFGARLGNSWGGLLALAAYASSPTFIVFGPLVLTDVAVTLFCVLTIWTFADLWRAPSRAATIRFGLAFAGALLSKFSSGLLLFGFLAFLLLLRWRPLPGQPDAKSAREEFLSWRHVRRRAVRKGILIASAVVYAVYFILSWNQSTDFLAKLGSGAASLALRRLLMPPALYLRGLFFFVVQSSRPTFVLGHSYPHGVWFYFPVVFLLKSTLAFLLLLALAAVVGWIARARLGRGAVVPEGMEFHWRAVWVFLAVFTIACLLSRLNLSIRHFTVPIALLTLSLSLLPRAVAELRQADWLPARPVALLILLLALASLITAARIYPHYFPYLNSLAFGRPGYELVNDSNLDWNQSLPEVEHFVRRNGISHVLLDPYGFSDPRVYVPEAEFWDCQVATPEQAGMWAVVSAGMIEDGANCSWLFNYPHRPLAGGSMYAFQLPAVIPPAGSPGGPPLPEDVRNLGGMPRGLDVRMTFYKCIMDPRELQPSFDWMMVQFQNYQSQQQKH
jgi:hypothetical protein